MIPIHKSMDTIAAVLAPHMKSKEPFVGVAINHKEATLVISYEKGIFKNVTITNNTTQEVTTINDLVILETLGLNFPISLPKLSNILIYGQLTVLPTGNMQYECTDFIDEDHRVEYVSDRLCVLGCWGFVIPYFVKCEVTMIIGMVNNILLQTNFGCYIVKDKQMLQDFCSGFPLVYYKS